MVEKEIRLWNGWPFLGLLLLVFPALVVGLSIIVAMNISVVVNAAAGIGIGLLIVLWLFGICGFIVVYPNEARVVQLFGKYIGTLREPGYYFGNPFYKAQKISLRIQTFETGQQKTPERKDAAGNVLEASQTRRMPSKVNDKDGTPIEIAAVIVWRVINTVEAVFNVDDIDEFVHIQSEAALRNMASQYSYDAQDEEHSLRGHIDEIAGRLKREVQERLSNAGAEVMEARISYLAYAPEIAAAMLQRQQAGAVIAARSRIVEGAVSMVEHALEMLSEKKIVELDAERKAAMVSNLLVVLCGHAVPQPVVNTGSIYH